MELWGDFVYNVGRYCLADDRLVNAVEFLDLGAGACAELLQVFICLLVRATISE